MGFYFSWLPHVSTAWARTLVLLITGSTTPVIDSAHVQTTIPPVRYSASSRPYSRSASCASSPSHHFALAFGILVCVLAITEAVCVTRTADPMTQNQPSIEYITSGASIGVGIGPTSTSRPCSSSPGSLAAFARPIRSCGTTGKEAHLDMINQSCRADWTSTRACLPSWR